jgi:hypothetical protein
LVHHFCSYLHHGHLYALPIDAAAPAASFRPDLLDRHGLPEPKVLSDVVSIAKPASPQSLNPMTWFKEPTCTGGLICN